jgi:hypothetical protein
VVVVRNGNTNQNGESWAHKGNYSERLKTLTIEEIRERFDGNWVLVKLTAFDERQRAARGKVLAHSPDRVAIHEALVAEKQDEKRWKRSQYFIFFAEPLLTSGPEFDAAAERIVADIRRALAGERARRVR